MLITQTTTHWGFTICICCGTCFETTCDITLKTFTLRFLVSGIRLSPHCDAMPLQLITSIFLSVCPPPPAAGSPPPGKADRLPPQVTGLLDGNQKLPRPSQAAHLLHPGAV